MSSAITDDRLDPQGPLGEIFKRLGSSCGFDKTLFSLLKDQIQDVIFVLDVLDLPGDTQYRFVYVNRRFQETTGLPESEVVGKLVDDIIPASSLPLAKGKYREAIDTKQCVRWDEVSTYPNGIKVGEVAVMPLFDADEKYVVLFGSVHDVTERYLAEFRASELEERWRLALEASGAAAWDWNRQTGILSLSEQWKEILGSDQTSIAFGEPSILEHYVHPEDRDVVRRTLSDVACGRCSVFTLEARFRHLFGHWVWVRSKGKAIADSHGKVMRVLGTSSNVSKEKAAEEALELSALVFQHSSEAIAIFDRTGHIVMVNPAFLRMRGYTQDEIIGQSSRLYNAGLADSDFYNRIWAQIAATGQWKGETWSRHKDGRLIAEFRSINAALFPDGSVRNYIEIATDITQNKKSEELLWKQANYDNLTGLPNRHLFHDRLHQAVAKTHRGEPAFTVLYIDLDHFKEVNDTLGHSVGDRLLQEAARRLLACTRETDTVCRIGGDEFTVLLTSLHNNNDGDPDAIDRIAQAIVKALAKPFRIDAETMHVSASVGITNFPRDAHDIESLMKHADQAMYEAKRQGRNRYAYFSHAMQERAQVRRRMIDDLRYAVKKGEMHVNYQPIVDLRSGKIVKAEALLRWQHPTRGWISPVEFVPLCEETGLILEIGEWIFHTVVADAARWIRAGHAGVKLGVNVSPSQIIKGGASCERCLAFLEAQKLPRHAIVLEVTESSLLHNDPIVQNQLRQFVEHGVALALDDFGTGYSALSYLQQYEFQYLKIDRSFVQNVSRGTTKLALCETIVLMAQKLGMQVISEGIETRYEADLLRDVGCDFGQGYYFYKPLTTDEFEGILMTHPVG